MRGGRALPALAGLLLARAALAAHGWGVAADRGTGWPLSTCVPGCAPAGLYKGLLPNIMKLAPAAGIGWYVFEETKLALGLDPRD